ncbi:MAG: carboxypeptidase-like regulatory domain-containing protein [Acidobacteriaceae bacterium]|nr:carboxypeptidase-like regulatory domain-containing protein [Acidobacteriaceae bacterium]
MLFSADRIPVSFQGLWLAVVLLCCSSHASAQFPEAPTPATGVVNGSVVDSDGNSVQAAHVHLVTTGPTVVQQDQETGADGSFHFVAVPAGEARLTITAESWRPLEKTLTVSPTVPVDMGSLRFTTATASFAVNALSQHDAAELEIKKAEQQRLLGVLPNFEVSYNWSAPRLDSKQKFELATRQTIDPITFGVNLAAVGVYRGTGHFQEFGPGAEGFWKFYGATMADVAVGTEFGGAIYPSLFHQDPRYFWKGSGTTRSRVEYALSRAFVTRGDNGKTQPNYSGILGSLTAGAMTNLYYPEVDRNSASKTFANAGLDVLGDAIGNLVQEFVLKHFTPKSKEIPSNAPESQK